MELAAAAEGAVGGAEPLVAPAVVGPVRCPPRPAEELAPLAQAVTSRPAAAQATTRPVADAASPGPVPPIPVTPHLVPKKVTSWTRAAAYRFRSIKPPTRPRRGSRPDRTRGTRSRLVRGGQRAQRAGADHGHRAADGDPADIIGRAIGGDGDPAGPADEPALCQAGRHAIRDPLVPQQVAGYAPGGAAG